MFLRTFFRYAWSGYVLECNRCGVIYRSRQFWYGNKEPTAEATVVRAEVCHVWDGGAMGSTGHNTARRLLDGMATLSEAVAGVSKAPSVALSAWVADQIAPKYWRPNAQITHCHSCRTQFDLDSSKHHCRFDNKFLSCKIFTFLYDVSFLSGSP
jgi:zinc finger FYVE domain-containing protein 1